MKIIPLDEKKRSRISRPASIFRCIRSSAAWASRRPNRRPLQQQSAMDHGRQHGQQGTRRGHDAVFAGARRGALFEVGDGHAAQGNGEVDITAIETSLIGTFQFIVRKDMQLNGRAPKPRRTTSRWVSTTI